MRFIILYDGNGFAMHEERDTLWCLLWSTVNLIMLQYWTCMIDLAKRSLTWSWSNDFAVSCLESDSRVWSNFMHSSLTAVRSCIIFSCKTSTMQQNGIEFFGAETSLHMCNFYHMPTACDWLFSIYPCLYLSCLLLQKRSSSRNVLPFSDLQWFYLL